MKIKIELGDKEGKIRFLRFVKTLTGWGLSDTRVYIDDIYDNNKKTVILETPNFEETLILFYKEGLKDYGFTIKKYRVEVINDLLRENTDTYVMENEDDYPKYLEAFNFLYKKDKKNLREHIMITLEEYKKKKIVEYLHLDKHEATKVIEEIEKIKI